MLGSMKAAAQARGGCYCGNITFTADLTKPIKAFKARASDCDFCVRHGASFVSDPAGRLAIRTKGGALSLLLHSPKGAVSDTTTQSSEAAGRSS